MSARVSRPGTLERAQAELDAGRLWRAKEILAGHLSHADSYPAAFALHGRVLARMGDTKEAGKFLLLSGVEPADDSEREAIALFADAMLGKPWQWIYSQFPLRARKPSLSEYPERTQALLRGWGFDEKPGRLKDAARPRSSPSRVQDVLATAAGFVVFAVILIGLVHGCSVVVAWVSHR